MEPRGPNIESPAKGLCIVAKEPYDFDFPVSDPAKRRDCALEVAHQWTLHRVELNADRARLLGRGTRRYASSERR